MNIETIARECGDDWDHTLKSDKAFLERFANAVIATHEGKLQAQSEPVGKVIRNGVIKWAGKYPDVGTELYAAPVQQDVNQTLLEAAKEFVRKVEAGEAKSKASYEQFKAAIAQVEGKQ